MEERTEESQEALPRQQAGWHQQSLPHVFSAEDWGKTLGFGEMGSVE